MTVKELIEELSYVADQDIEVRLAFQPSWPFEHRIATVAEVDFKDGYEVVLDADAEYGDDPGMWVVLRTDGDYPECEQGDFAHADDATKWLNDKLERDGVTANVVYIAEGSQLGYLPGAASSALGWR